MNTVKHAAHYVSEETQAGGSEESKEGNKNLAKDSHAPISTRAHAARDTVADKVEKSGHDEKAQFHKEAVKH